MKNKNIVKILAICILTILLVSTFALPVFATVDGEEASPTFWDQFADGILYILELLFAALIVIFYIIFGLIVIIIVIIYGAIWLLFELGGAVVDLIMLIVNAIIGLF